MSSLKPQPSSSSNVKKSGSTTATSNTTTNANATQNKTSGAGIAAGGGLGARNLAAAQAAQAAAEASATTATTSAAAGGAETAVNQNITQQLLSADNAVARLHAARQATLALRPPAGGAKTDDEAESAAASGPGNNLNNIDDAFNQLAYEHRLKKAKLFTEWMWIKSLAIIFQYIFCLFNALVEPGHMPLWGVSFFIDIVDMLDMIYQQRRESTEYDMLDEAEKARRQNETVKEVKHELLVILYDSVTVAPLEIFAWLCPRESRLHWAAILRCMRLFRVYKSFAVLSAYGELAASSTMTVRNITFLLVMLCALHTTACVWYASACNYAAPGTLDLLCTRGSWMLPVKQELTELLRTNSSWDIQDFTQGINVTMVYTLTPGLTYWLSLYFAFNSLVLNGFGDILPTNQSELLWALLFGWLGGFVIFNNAILGAIASMLTNFDVSRFAFKHRLLALMQHLQDQNATSQLTQHTISYYEYLWTSKGGTQPEGLLQELPYTLRAEIAMAVNGNVIDKSPLFNNLPESFLRAITLKVKSLQVLPDEIVMRRNVPSNAMMYIHRGELELLSDTADEAPMIVLRNGKLIGEINLITRLTRKYTIRAITHCDMLTITDEDLNELLGLYPEAMEDLILRAEERFGIEMPSLVMRRHVALDNLPNTTALEQQQKNQQQQPQQQQQRTENLALNIKSTEDANELLYKAKNLIKQAGEKLRPLLAALHMERPEKTLALTPSINFFRIEDPILSLLQKAERAGRENVFQRAWVWFETFEIDPRSAFSRFWMKLIIALSFFITFAYPFIIAFLPYAWLTQTSPSIGWSLIVFTYLMDICLNIDVFLNFRKHIVTPNGIIKDLAQCRKAYMSTTLFKADMIASLPFEVFAFLDMGNFWYWYGMLKLNRICKVYHLFEFIGQGMEGIDTSIARMRLYLIGFMILFVTHVCACFAYMQACPSNVCPDNNTNLTVTTWTTWMAEDFLRKIYYNPVGNVEPTWWFDYCSSIYYTVTGSGTYTVNGLYSRQVTPLWVFVAA